ncbi:helix-turn-helix transcriptional regulator [Patescibacteria group bacterium]|nr:helix-turn-helix transcriptional regulator [Patescibacteria group bacterium]
MIENNIKVLRAKHDMTQEELAEKSGVTRQTILAIEKKKYFPSLKLAFDITQVFKVEIGEVFYLTGDNNEEN